MKVKVITLLLAIGIVYSCKKDEDETIPVTFEEAIEVDSDSIQQISVDTIKPIEIRLWSSKETGLPIGEVIRKDCANWGEKDVVMADNYILVRKPDNVFTIKRDVDVDLFLCVGKGDKIID